MTTATATAEQPVPVITLPNGRPVRLREYVRSARIVRTLAPDTRVDGWSQWGATAAEISREIDRGQAERINLCGLRRIDAGGDGRNGFGSWYGRGRRWSAEWYRDVERCARLCNGRFVVRLRDIPPEYRARLAHRITEPEY